MLISEPYQKWALVLNEIPSMKYSDYGSCILSCFHRNWPSLPLYFLSLGLNLEHHKMALVAIKILSYTTAFEYRESTTPWSPILLYQDGKLFPQAATRHTLHSCRPWLGYTTAVLQRGWQDRYLPCLVSLWGLVSERGEKWLLVDDRETLPQSMSHAKINQ